MKLKQLTLFLMIGFLFLTSCTLTKSINYHVDQDLLEKKHIFNSTQAPTFTMQLSDNFKYIGQRDKSISGNDGSYKCFEHYFVNDKEMFGVRMQMITFESVLWSEWKTWPPKWDLGKENHGAKQFRCGTNIFNVKIHKKDMAMFQQSNMFKKDTIITTKDWISIQTGNGMFGGTQIVIRYFEMGNKTNDITAFIGRANNRTLFKIGK